MNPPDSYFKPDVEEQAALWAARLEGSPMGDADRGELDAWLAGDPARRALLSTYCDLSSDLGEVLPALAAAGALEMPRPRKAAGGRRFPLFLAAVGLAAAVAAAVWLGMPGGRVETIATAVGQRKSFTLADGTRVELNANTSVFVESGRSERRVRLADGEAFFVVSKDKERPFIVETPAGSVRVTGTIFNVRTEATSQLDVTVVEGSVQVRPGQAAGAPPAEAVALGAGDQLSRQPGGVAVRALSPSDVDDALAWRQGQIVCVGMPLSDALAQFAHYHGLRVSVTPGAAVLSIGGRFGLDDVDSFYGDIERMLKVRVLHEPGGGVRVSLPTEP